MVTHSFPDNQNTINMVKIGLNSPVTWGGYDQLWPAMTSNDQPWPQNSRWSLVLFRRLLTIVRWSLEILGGLWVYWGPLCSLLSVGECRTMVFHSQRKVLMVFSSQRPLIVGDWSVTSITYQSSTNCRPPRVLPNYAFCQQPVSYRSATGCRPVKDHYQLSGDLIVETSCHSRLAAV